MTPSGKKEFIEISEFWLLASMKEGNAMIIAFHTANKYSNRRLYWRAG